MIDEVTRTIVGYLTAATVDLGATWIEPTSLEADGALTADKLHVCLYAVEEHEHLRNQPLIPTNGEYQRPPLALRLHYVMAYQGSHLEAQGRLARVIQVFHTHPILRGEALRPALLELVDQITVRLRTPSADERNQIWTAFGRPLRLSLYYDVDVAQIAPLEHDGAGRVVEHRLAYAEVQG